MAAFYFVLRILKNELREAANIFRRNLNIFNLPRVPDFQKYVKNSECATESEIL